MVPTARRKAVCTARVADPVEHARADMLGKVDYRVVVRRQGGCIHRVLCCRLEHELLSILGTHLSKRATSSPRTSRQHGTAGLRGVQRRSAHGVRAGRRTLNSARKNANTVTETYHSVQPARFVHAQVHVRVWLPLHLADVNTIFVEGNRLN